MIESIRIKNIALINETIIDFEKGLNVISGETGTGKSILVNSMNLLLGDRADHDLIKSGCDYGEVEAVFYVEDSLYRSVIDIAGIEPGDDNQLIIFRKITTDGRNTCRINGCAVNLSTLKNCMELVADLHGQHAHQSLLYSKNQLSFVDSYSKEDTAPVRLKIAKLRDEYISLVQSLEGMSSFDAKDIEKQLDYLYFQEEELRKADLKEGEEDELETELRVIENAEDNAKCLKESYEVLYGGDGHTVLNDLNYVVERIASIKDLSPIYNDIYESLSNSYYSIEDSAHSILHESGNVRFDEERINEIRDRLDTIYSIKRKYGNTVTEVLEHYKEINEKIDTFSHYGEKTAAIRRRIDEVTDELYELHIKLLEIRQTAAEELEPKIIGELNDLGMKGCKFSISFEEIPEKDKCSFSKTELTHCEFMISTNPGEPEKPLSKVASGGEISRIMLAFKNVFARVDDIDVLIFDEIDTGISGNMARIVAEKMFMISRFKQIVCITHLPQIVSFGDANYSVEKKSHESVTESIVKRLDKEEKTYEVARLTGGTGPIAYSNAAEIIEDAETTKINLLNGRKA